MSINVLFFLSLVCCVGRLFRTLIHLCTTIRTLIPFTHPDFIILFCCFFFCFITIFASVTLFCLVFLWPSSFSSTFNKKHFYYFLYAHCTFYNVQLAQTISCIVSLLQFRFISQRLAGFFCFFVNIFHSVCHMCNTSSWALFWLFQSTRCYILLLSALTPC